MRAIFFDEALARAVVGQLTSQGWTAQLARERFHGEDDDEDHPWAVVSDAPAVVLEVLVEENEGWLDTEPPGTAPEPVELPELPESPKRIKRT